MTREQLEMAMELSASVAAVVVTARGLAMAIDDEDVRKAVYLLFGQGAVERLEAESRQMNGGG